jgi:nicotinate-nucleotide adenylyltransferase
MDFFLRAAGTPHKLGILAGTFNPPTRAHLALARTALAVVDEVVFVLPREFPHKTYEGVGFACRLTMLKTALAEEPRCSIAATDQGLFIDIARECRRAYGAATEFYFLCGRDAAERVVNWDYGRPGAIQEQLREYQLLVARRQGEYEPPAELHARIHPLELEAGYGEISASAVRERIRAGQRWEHLVPEAVVGLVRRYYGGSG